MIGLVARRLVRVAAVVWLVGVIGWLLTEAAPGDLTERAARAAGVLPADDLALPSHVRANLLAHVSERHDLDAPRLTRLARFATGLLVADLGASWRDGGAVSEHLASAIGPTLLLVLLALSLAAIAGVIAAVVSARGPGGVADTALAVASAAAFSLPPVWLAMIGLRVLADGHPWRVLPPGGLSSTASLVLPVICLAALPAFAIARHARAALIEASASSWAIAARARGATQARIVAHHGTRVALPALMPLVTVITAYLVGATLVIEQVFAIRGLGSLLVTAASRGDAPVIVGVCMCAGVIVGLASAASDIAQRLLDPRLREESP